jgi:hypothetical protein
MIVLSKDGNNKTQQVAKRQKEGHYDKQDSDEEGNA